MPPRFGELLQDWRRKAGISQKNLAESIGKTAGWVSQVETGPGQRSQGIGPPDRETCDAMDKPLNLRPGTAWRSAAVERMRTLDPELADYHTKELARVRGEADRLVETEHQRYEEEISSRDGAEVVGRATADAVLLFVVRGMSKRPEMVDYPLASRLDMFVTAGAVPAESSEIPTTHLRGILDALEAIPSGAPRRAAMAALHATADALRTMYAMVPRGGGVSSLEAADMTPEERAWLMRKRE